MTFMKINVFFFGTRIAQRPSPQASPLTPSKDARQKNSADRQQRTEYGNNFLHGTLTIELTLR